MRFKIIISLEILLFSSICLSQQSMSDQYQKARGNYLSGIHLISGVKFRKDVLKRDSDGVIGNYSGNLFELYDGCHSAHAFYKASDGFGAIAEIDPHFAGGKALELWVLSKLALESDLNFIIYRSDKVNILNFLVKIVNYKYDINLNYLDERNPYIKKYINIEGVKTFLQVRRAKILQKLFEYSMIKQVENLSCLDIWEVALRYQFDEKDEEMEIKVLKKYVYLFNTCYEIPETLARIYYKRNDLTSSIKYYELVRDNAPNEEYRKSVQNTINTLKQKLK